MGPTKPSLSSPFALVVAAPGGFQRLREKETILLKSHNWLKEAKGGTFRVCTEMPKQFIQTLLKCADSPQPALVSYCGYRGDVQQREFWVAGCPLRWCSVMVRRLRAERRQSDTDISYGVCAARVERPCLYVRQNTSACAVAQTVHIYFTFRELLEVWASGVWSWPCF